MAALKHSPSWFWSVWLVVLDLAALFICGLVVSEMRNASVLPNFTAFDEVVIVVSCFLCLAIVGGYDTKRNMCTLRYASEHVLAMTAAMVFAFFVTYVFSSYNNSIKPGRSVLLLAILMFTPLSLLCRRLWSRRTARRASTRRVYVLGKPELEKRLRELFGEHELPNPFYFVDFDAWEKEKISDQIFSQRKGECEAVVLDLFGAPLSQKVEERLLEINLHAAPVYPVESFIETYSQKIDLTHVTLSWALDGTFKADHHSAYGKIKAIIDTVVAMVLFLVLLPVMLLTALLIVVADSRPVLFRQTRVGRFSRPFTLYKFRTMSSGPDEKGSPYTLENDPRITKVGRFLRLTRLDELPQLWNVIQGDMSMIGPRAEWDQLVEKYKSEIPFYHLRFIVKPGITGWAQVNYGYGAGVKDAFEKLQYDLYYIKHCSPQMDASIILKTLFTILSASGR
jgi:exopolysaccharide biosynthesis polyprenyl glycosylphosphotransferase